MLPFLMLFMVLAEFLYIAMLTVFWQNVLLVVVLKSKGELRIFPLKRVDLRKFFDSLDLGVDAIGDWREFERKLVEKMEE